MKTSKTLNKGWWISLGIMVVVAILAVIIFVKPAPKTPAPIADPTTSATAKAVSGCNVPKGDTSPKPAMPKDLRWEAAKGWTWPVSDTYGPTQTKNGYGVCFAQSPLGAALTAVSFNAAANTLSAEEATEIYVMGSPGKEVLRKTLSEDSKAETPAIFVGFSVDSFTPEEAQITVVVATDKSSTGYAGIPESFQWVDGDWQLKVLDDGRFMTGQITYPVAGQFVKWSGQNG